MTAFSSREKLELKEFLSNQGFMFEKRKLRSPGTKEIKEITIGTRILDRDKYGQTVIGINLDAERDPWFVAPTREESQLSPIIVPDIKDEKLKLAASMFISKVKHDLQAVLRTEKPVETPEEKEFQNNGPEKAKPPETGLPVCDTPITPIEKPVEQSAKNPNEATKPRYEAEPMQLQVIKNVGQAKISLTKNTKGYSWEITSYADNMKDAIDQAIAADQRLKIQFGSET